MKVAFIDEWILCKSKSSGIVETNKTFLSSLLILKASRIRIKSKTSCFGFGYLLIFTDNSRFCNCNCYTPQPEKVTDPLLPLPPPLSLLINLWTNSKISFVTFERKEVRKEARRREGSKSSIVVVIHQDENKTNRQHGFWETPQ